MHYIQTQKKTFLRWCNKIHDLPVVGHNSLLTVGFQVKAPILVRPLVNIMTLKLDGISENVHMERQSPLFDLFKAFD